MSLCLNFLDCEWFFTHQILIGNYKTPMASCRWYCDTGLTCIFFWLAKVTNRPLLKSFINILQIYCKILNSGTHFFTTWKKRLNDQQSTPSPLLIIHCLCKIIDFINNWILLFSWMNTSSPWNLLDYLLFKSWSDCLDKAYREEKLSHWIQFI